MSLPVPSAFTTLPYELLAHIFLFIPHQYGHLRFSALVRALTSISAVCSVWRQVAIGTAGLWANITIEHYASSDRLSDIIQYRTMAFLQRSKMAPLDLSIRRLGDRRVRAALWSAVVPHLKRCRSLSIVVSYGGETTFLWTAMQRSSFPILEHFSLEDLRLQSLDYTNAAPEDLLGQQPLPRLRHVAYRAAHPHKPPTPIAPSLQTLNLTVDHLDESLLFLANYPDVAALKIRFLSSTRITSPLHVLLPGLRALETNHPALLSNLATPALSTLAFEGVMSQDLPPGTDPIGSGGLSYFGELHLVRFTHCNLFIDDNIPAFMTKAKMANRLEISNCIGTHVFLSNLLVGHPSQETLGADPRERDFLENSENGEDRNHSVSRLLLPSLTHLTVIDDSSENGELVSAVLHELLSTRTSLHVKCDLQQLRDETKYPSPVGQNNDEDGPLTYFAGRLVILNAPGRV